jgi:glycogen operon protein
VDDSFVLIFNAHDAAIDFTLPGPEYGQAWTPVIDSDHAEFPDGDPVKSGGVVRVGARALVVLQGAD